MITVKKDFQDLKFQRDFLKKEIGAYHILNYIHKYDKQKLKSLLNERLQDENREYQFVKE